MTNARILRLLVVLALVGGLFGVAAPAQADWTENVRYVRQYGSCNDTGDGYQIGGGMYMQELGKNRVVQMRAKYLLYAEDPNSNGIHQSVGRMTKSSAVFPNDNRSFFYDANRADNEHLFNLSSQSAGEWWVVVKLTWDRKLRRDWNVKVPLVYCNFGA